MFFNERINLFSMLTDSFYNPLRKCLQLIGWGEVLPEEIKFFFRITFTYIYLVKNLEG